jgi:hypothetical protein
MTEEILIPKDGYKVESAISNCYVIYRLVNGVSKVPYKINQELLQFILLNDNNKLNLLIYSNTPHKFENINRTKYQDKIYKSHVDKVLLQESILDVAYLYSNFSTIYFFILYKCIATK